MESPACEAVTVHAPAPVMCTVELDTLHLPVAAKETLCPEEAAAEMSKSASPKVFAASAPKVMVWLAFVTVKDRSTSGAAARLPSPGCEALTVQVPVAKMVTVLPPTEQTAGVVELKLTASPEEAVALTTNGASPKVLFESVLKVID